MASSDLAGVQDGVETLASMQSGPGQCAVWTSTGKKTFQSFCPRWCSPLSFTPPPLKFNPQPPKHLVCMFLRLPDGFLVPAPVLDHRGRFNRGEK